MNHVGTFHLNDLDRFCPPCISSVTSSTHERTPPLKIPVEKSLGKRDGVPWAVQRPLVS